MEPTRRRPSRVFRVFASAFGAFGLCAALAACSVGQGPTAGTQAHVGGMGGTTSIVRKARAHIARFFHHTQDPKAAVARGFQVMEEADPTLAAVPDPKVLESYAQIMQGGGYYSVGKPYEINGTVYQPQEDPSYNMVGRASWYGPSFHGRKTANGEFFDSTSISAAHPTLPLPSYVRVTNLTNDRSIVVRVNDRGPYRGGRLIDVSEQTAKLLGFRRSGTAKVRVQYVGRAPLVGEDKGALLATYRGPNSSVPRVFAASAAPVLPMAPDAFAFASEPRPTKAAAAINRLSRRAPAVDRIQMAFQAAADAEKKN